VSAETVLYSTLSGAAPVSAIVGTNIFPDAAPQDLDPPFIVYNRIGTEPTTTIHGTVVATKVAIEVLCLAETRAVVEGLADAVVTALIAAGFEYLDRSGEFEPTLEKCQARVQVNHLS
jgi:hypothetical protein